MILASYLRRQILKPFFLTFLALSSVFSIYMLGRYLAQAAEGEIPVEVVLKLIWWRLLIAQEIILPATSFLALVFGLNRLFRNAEMFALFACGFGKSRLWRALLPLLVGLLLLVTSGSLWVRPVAWNNFYTLKEQFAQTFDLSRLKRGVFYALPGGETFFAEEIDPHLKEARHVFLYQREGQKSLKVTYAEKAKEVLREGRPFLILEEGRRYEFQNEEGLVLVSEFEEFAFPLPFREKTTTERLKTFPTGRLFTSRKPPALAELQWRLAAPLGALGLFVLGVSLSPSRPRQRGARPLVLALLAFVFYFYGSVFLKKLVAQGALAPLPGIFLAPASLGIAALGSYFFFWRVK